mmetsp:Transcript_20737/g.44033  ORF Transcript_20737/g.44033 Transcript_20737/m.44033 type:complete len:414 (+) Transcript_20737:408-1649(+)
MLRLRALQHAQQLHVEAGVGWQRVHREVARAAKLVPPEKVRALRVEQERDGAILHRRARAGDLLRGGVLRDGDERHPFRSEKLAHAHEVEVRRHEEQRAPLRTRREGAEQRREQPVAEGVEARVGGGGGVVGGESHEELAQRGRHLGEQPGVRGARAHAAGDIARGAEEGVQLGRGVGGEEDGLPEARRGAVEKPRAHAREVGVALLRGQLVECVEQLAEVRPVLHEQHVGVRHEQHLDRGEPVDVALLRAVAQSDAQPQRRGDHQIGLVEARVELERLARDAHAALEAVVVVPGKEQLVVLRLRRRHLRGALLFAKLSEEARLVLHLLVRGGQQREQRLHEREGLCAEGQHDQHGRAGEPLVLWRRLALRVPLQHPPADDQMLHRVQREHRQQLRVGVERGVAVQHVAVRAD